MTRNLKLLSNFVEKFLGTVKFGNDQIAPILGYGDLVQGNVTIKRVYYIKGMNHNLFFVGQFYEADLEVAFQKSTCYIRDLKGNDLLTDGENLEKMKQKGDACIFVGYSTQSRAYRVYNKRTRVIIETIHVNFKELPHMASDHVSSDPRSTIYSSIEHSKNTETTNHAPTQATTVTATENINQAETDKENAQVKEDDFINLFSTSVQEQGETSSRYVDLSNMHTFYQRHPSEHRWTKDHPLEQVIGNPSQSIRTRRQLETNCEMCMFALTVSQTKPKNIKEVMADSAWIEAMQEELH
ncbi:retrovirus-related pol polyprotein from transposon TNT 1-94 [Tanacetum coccineum]